MNDRMRLVMIHAMDAAMASVKQEVSEAEVLRADIAAIKDAHSKQTRNTLAFQSDLVVAEARIKALEAALKACDNAVAYQSSDYARRVSTIIAAALEDTQP